MLSTTVAAATRGLLTLVRGRLGDLATTLAAALATLTEDAALTCDRLDRYRPRPDAAARRYLAAGYGL